MGRWHRYWFAEGGRTSAAILRIAIAAAVLLSLWRLWRQPELAAPAGIYRPVGVWMLLGGGPPPALLVDVLWIAAWGGTLAMLAGAWTRAATAISFGAAAALAALSFSGSVTWSHQYNVIFVAQIAFLGARGGDALSIDALVRRRRGLPPLDVPRGYQWSVRLVLLSVSLMFIGAALFKLGSGLFTLRWALSDNLRHQLLIRYDLVGLERPAIVDWLLEDVWRYRTAALLNIASQLAPLLAVVFVRRPGMRAFAGACFVLEIIGLGAVMSLWNLHWLPLAAVFVDWDRLVRAAPPPEPPESWRPPRGRRVFVIAFFAYELATSLIPTIDQKLNTFPFSSYPMFAAPIRAAKPYDQHLPFGVAGDHYEAISDQPLTPRAQRWLDHANRGLHAVRDPAQLQARLAAVLARAQATYPEFGIRGLRHYVSLFVAPAYPAPARFERHDLAITGELLPGGVFRSLLGKLTKSRVIPQPQNLDPKGARFFYFRDDRPEPRVIGGPFEGDGAPFVGLDDPVYVVAELDAQRWLVAWRRTLRLW